MSAEMLINCSSREIRIAFLEENSLQEIFIERLNNQSLVGNIYKGKVSRIVPGINAAFVDIGLDRAGFLHCQDCIPNNLDISTLFRLGQEVLVQVYKEPIGTKGARLTTQLTLPSRYLVLTPGNPQVTVSQKITDPEEQKRLLSLINPQGNDGYIFRTVAEGIEKSKVDTDLIYLSNLWKEIKGTIKNVKACGLVYEDLTPPLRTLRDVAGYDLTKIQVDEMNWYNSIRHYTKHAIPHLYDKIEYYSDKRPLFDTHSVEKEIEKALSRKVFLKSGAYLVFDQTEAMTTIDVNTGSFTGHGDFEETILQTNLEAAKALARQLRLRNIGGIIIIDFIDMENASHKAKVIEALMEQLNKDEARIDVGDVSPLGVVQLTRKRTRESLENTLCVTCPSCRRRGTIKSVETVSFAILREIKRFSTLVEWKGFLVKASEDVINYLTKIDKDLATELADLIEAPIQFQVEVSFTQEQYEVLPLDEERLSVKKI